MCRTCRKRSTRSAAILRITQARAAGCGEAHVHVARCLTVRLPGVPATICPGAEHAVESRSQAEMRVPSFQVEPGAFYISTRGSPDLPETLVTHHVPIGDFPARSNSSRTRLGKDLL